MPIGGCWGCSGCCGWLPKPLPPCSTNKKKGRREEESKIQFILKNHINFTIKTGKNCSRNDFVSSYATFLYTNHLDYWIHYRCRCRCRYRFHYRCRCHCRFHCHYFLGLVVPSHYRQSLLHQVVANMLCSISRIERQRIMWPKWTVNRKNKFFSRIKSCIMSSVKNDSNQTKTNIWNSNARKALQWQAYFCGKIRWAK